MQDNMYGGAYNPRYYTGELYRLSHLFHHLARKSNYHPQGNIKDINFHHIESADGKKFYPIGDEYEILWEKLKKVKQVQQKIAIYQNRKKLNRNTLFKKTVIKDIPNPEMFFKALGDHIWGFLKNKEGDLTKNLKSATKSSSPIGHTIGTGIHARKLAELVTTMLLLNHGVTIKQIYQNKNSAGRINDLSLSHKIMLLHILEKAQWKKAPEKSKKSFISKYLIRTPVDLLMSSIYRQKYYRNLLNSSDYHQIPEMVDDLEFIRELGNLSAHAGRPQKNNQWQNRISDDQQDDLASALLDLLDYMLKNMNITYQISRKSHQI